MIKIKKLNVFLIHLHINVILSIFSVHNAAALPTYNYQIKVNLILLFIFYEMLNTFLAELIL